MSSAIAPVQNGALAVSNEDRDIIRKTYAKDLNDVEFQMLIAESEHRGLDIVKGEIRAIKFQGQLAIFPTVHGITKLAGRTGMLDGIEGPFWCGSDGRWVEVWDSDTPPAAAKVIVHRRDRKFPTVRVAAWRERKQTYFKDGKEQLMPTWKKMPAHMLGKVAYTDALKASGLIGDERVWIEEDEDVDGMNVRVIENQWDAGSRHVHKAVADRGLGGHVEARALTAAVEPGVTSLKDAPPSAMHSAAEIAANLDPAYARSLIDGTANLADTPTAVVSDPIDNERSEWRLHVEAEFAIADDPRSIATTFLKEAKQFPWRFQDLIELAPNRAFADRYRNAAITAGVDGQIVDTAFKRFEETQQIAEQRLKDTPLAELEVSSFDELRRALKLKEMAYAEFVDILGAAPETFGTAQVALDQYNEKMEEVGSDNADTFDDIDPEPGEITEPTLPGMGGDPGRYTK